jgi:hypothetical protein
MLYTLLDISHKIIFIIASGFAIKYYYSSATKNLSYSKKIDKANEILFY